MTVFASPRPASGFAVRRRDLVDRADVNYTRMEPVVADLSNRFRFPLTPLGRLVSRVQYGSSSKAVEEQSGPPMIRMTNLQDGDWDLDVLKYTTLDDSAQENYLLAIGDICFTRTNGSKDLVGKCAVFRESGAWVYASYVIRVRIEDQAGYLPEFLARFLNSDVGRVQIDRLSRQALMTNINSDEIKKLMVPQPDPRVQARMVRDLNGHWTQYRKRTVEMRRLLLQCDAEIVARMGLRPPVSVDRLVWAVSREALKGAGGRLNAEFFHPERVSTVGLIVGGATPSQRVDAVADFAKDKQDEIRPEDKYIGLANVERDTGELVETDDDEDDRPTGDVMRFRAGDILFGKLRPYLNKVHLADTDGVCSPEFFVLRPRNGIRPEYLAAMLRSQLTLAQTRHMAGGNTHPRLTPGDVHAMFIPVPSDKVQDEIADAESKGRAEARRLKVEAVRDWIAAKQRFGDDLVA
jgi:type I restriction enzyme, S subunit